MCFLISICLNLNHFVNVNPFVNIDNETRLKNFTKMVEQLSLTLNNSGILNQPKPNHSVSDRFLKVNVPDFEGTTSNLEDYVEQENSLERYFEFKETPDDQRFMLAKVKLTKLSVIWLKGIQKQQKREDRFKIGSWDKLKKHLRRKYAPTTYKQQLFECWGNLRQGSMTLHIKDRERLFILSDINEPEEMKIGRFLGGLREEIREKLEPMRTLLMMVHAIVI